MGQLDRGEGTINALVFGVMTDKFTIIHVNRNNKIKVEAMLTKEEILDVIKSILVVGAAIAIPMILIGYGVVWYFDKKVDADYQSSQYELQCLERRDKGEACL